MLKTCITVTIHLLVFFKKNFNVDNYAQLQDITTFLISVLHQSFKNEVAGEHGIYIINVVVVGRYLKNIHVKTSLPYSLRRGTINTAEADVARLPFSYIWDTHLVAIYHDRPPLKV